MRIEPNQLGLLAGERTKLLLGIVSRDGRVLLHEASAEGCPGHAEWLVEAPEIDPQFGFAMIASGGRVRVIMRSSRLNPAEEGYLLPTEALAELQRLLPLADDLAIYGT